MADPRYEKILENLKRIRLRIEGACARSGRAPAEVTLVAVTKSVDAQCAGLLLDAGVEHLGENRVAEAERKRTALPGRGTWHLIGHLQRNKVLKALSLFKVIHSVDSLRLLEELSSRLDGREEEREILLEVNVSGEESKYGFRPEALEEALARAAALPGLRLRGLMTMAPFSDDPEDARPHFRRLRELLVDARRSGLAEASCTWLSMGMTGDFEVAVEEGATHVRIGTALFEGL